MKTATFKIDGMRCDGCADTIKRLLTVQAGVRAASVSFKDGEARVLYDPDTVGEDQLASIIEKPGYRVLSPA
jgi:copper chaperone CopZ